MKNNWVNVLFVELETLFVLYAIQLGRNGINAVTLKEKSISFQIPEWNVCRSVRVEFENNRV